VQLLRNDFKTRTSRIALAFKVVAVERETDLRRAGLVLLK
jgi:hypothetical protein